MSLENAILEHAAALKELAAAIRDNAGGVAAPAASTGKTSSEKPAATTKTTTANTSDDAGDTGPIHWANNKKGTFGEAADQAAYDALKKKDKDIVKITPTKYAEKVKAAEEAAAAEAEKGSGSEAPAATKEQLVKAAQAYLPKDLDDDEKETRKAFVKGMLERFGGSKITEIPEEHWGLVVNLIQRALAGQDVDPSDAEYEELEEESLV